MYGNCLEGMEDARGIEVLREIYRKVDVVDDSLETLSLIHREEIPELPELRRRRVEDQQRQLQRRKELDEMSAMASLKEVYSQSEDQVPAKILPMTAEKKLVGTNRAPVGAGRSTRNAA